MAQAWHAFGYNRPITRGLSDTLKFLKFSKDRPKHQLIVETSKIIYLQTKYTTLTDNMMNATKLNSNIGAIAHDVTHERQLSDEVRCTWNAVHFDVHIFFFRDGGTTARGNGRSRRTVPPQRITNELCIFARHASRDCQLHLIIHVCMQATRPRQAMASRKRRRSATVEDREVDTPTQRLVRPRRASTGASNGGAFHAKWDHVSNITEEKERQVYGKKAVCAKKGQAKRSASTKAPAKRSASTKAPLTRAAARQAQVKKTAPRKAIATKTKAAKAKASKNTCVTQTRLVGLHVHDLPRFCALLDAVEMMSAQEEDLQADAEEIIPCLQLLRDAPTGSSHLRRKRSLRRARV